MKGLAYFLIVLFPTLIIGVTVYLTRNWAPTGILTIVTWTVAWVGSMLIVTVLYLLLIHRPRMMHQQDSNKQKNGESKQH